MATPLTSQECELLEAVAARDPGAWSVLGDYWIEHVDAERGAFVHISNGENADRIDLADEEARLAAHAQRWRQLAIAAGYAERDLALAGGFLQWPIVVPENHPLDGHPDIVRISPRYIRERHQIRQGREFEIYAAEAVTPRTRTPIVLKVATYPELEYILEHERRILDGISHPNIARCLGWAVRTSGRALAFEWAGIDLRQLLRTARANRVELGLDFALSVGTQLFAGVAAMHAADVTNREIRTEHVAIAADGTVRMLDFGIASRSDLPTPGHRYVSPGLQADMGYRVSYMSSEQVLGRKLTPATDVYSAAIVIAELAAMEHPVPAFQNVMDQLLALRDGGFQAAPTLPAPLRIALGLALQRARKDRPCASEMAATLRATAQMLKLDIGPHVIARRLVELGVPS